MNLPTPSTTPPEPPPAPHLTALLQATVTPAAGGASHNHLTGLVAGPLASYGALEAWSHYPAGGVRNYNTGHRRRTRSHHGLEDGAKQRRD